MYPFQQSNELCFQISSDPYQENTIPQQDLIHLGHLDHDLVTFSTNKTAKSRQNHRRSNSTTHDNTKKMHRDIERQRRQEMAARCASLRSLLPLEFIKGKRSISDHMSEAVNYIKHLQDNISNLGAKRDELKRLLNPKSHCADATKNIWREESSRSRYSPYHVVVRPIVDGIQVLVSCGVREEDLPLSRVFDIVLQQGLIIVNSSSTKVNHRLHHTIQAQVREGCSDCIDPSGLQQKLTEAVFQSSTRFSNNSNLSDS